MHYSTGKKGYDQFFGNSKSFCLSDSALSDQNWKGLFVLDQKMRVNCMLGGGHLCVTKIRINSCTSNLFFFNKDINFFRSMTLKTHVWFAGLKLVGFRCFCDPRHGFRTDEAQHDGLHWVFHPEYLDSSRVLIKNERVSSGLFFRGRDVTAVVSCSVVSDCDDHRIVCGLFVVVLLCFFPFF